MKNILIALCIMLFAAASAPCADDPAGLRPAAPVVAGEFPIAYECLPDNKLEKQFCEGIKASLLKTGHVTFDVSHDRPYFSITVLPVVRGGYVSAAISADFVYPPFLGLALSAFTGCYLVMPGLLDDEVTDSISIGVIDGMSEWMLYAEDKLCNINRPRPMTLEVRND